MKLLEIPFAGFIKNGLCPIYLSSFPESHNTIRPLQHVKTDKGV